MSRVSRVKSLGSLIAFAGMVGAVHASCWYIAWGDSHFYGGAGAPCLSGCDAIYPHIYPGGNCAAPASTGSMQVACFPGITFINPDGTWGCNRSGMTTIVTVPSGMVCEAFCSEPIPE